MSDPLEFTGERFTPECVREIRYEHLHRYALAADLVRGLRVLDAACGEGYGSGILARTAASVTGVDNAEAAIGHARARYASPNLAFEVADCCALPFADGQFDAVVSFETLEHLEAQEQMLREFRRVLAPEGFLVISSPDRTIYTDRLQNLNPFHVRELDRGELERLLAAQFPAVRLLGQRLGFHSLIWALPDRAAAAAAGPDGGLMAGFHREARGSVERLHVPPGDAVYFIALCAASDRNLPRPGAAIWLFDDAGESVYRHYHHEIRKNMQAGRLLEERDRAIAELQAGRDRKPAAATAGPRRTWWHRLLGRS